MEEGDQLWSKVSTVKKWKKATVIRTKSDTSYDVEFEDGTHKRRHTDQTKAAVSKTSNKMEMRSEDSDNEHHQASESVEEVKPGNSTIPTRSREQLERLQYHRLGENQSGKM